MPRDGLGQYAPPAGTNAVPNATIESARYNTNVADVAQDLNTPRPIVAGGTGATTPYDARNNLDAEVAMQVVTNYDSHVFECGSFMSSPGATGAPEATKFYSGICAKVSEAAMYIEAYAEASAGTLSATKWVRFKWSSWGPWVQLPMGYSSGGAVGISGAAADMFFGTTTAPAASFIVNTESDITGTDALTVLKTGGIKVRDVAGTATVTLNAAPGGLAQLLGAKNMVGRWAMRMGDSATETGANAGSDFWLYGINDAGNTVTANGITIERKTGVVSIGGPGATYVNGALIARNGNGSNAGTIYLGETGFGRYLSYNGSVMTLQNNGSNFDIPSGNMTVTASIFCNGLSAGANGINCGVGGFICGGPITAAGNIVTGVNTTDGGLYFGSSAANALTYSGGIFAFTATANVRFGTPHASVNAPVTVGNNTSGIWPMGVSGNDRGILFLMGAGSNIVQYFTQGTTGNTTGSINTTTTTTSYVTSSSGELKEDLKSFNAGNIIDETNVYDFAWKSTGERSYGVIAQQAIDVYPLAVTHVEKVSDEIGEYWGVDYSKYVPVLLQELKALRARVADLEGRIDMKPQPA